MKRIKSISFWTILILIDCLIAGGISELWVRSFIPTRNICYLTDDKIGVRFCPNQKTYGHVEKGYKNIFITNSQGFHDVERSETKGKDTFRIHIYGDSMVQGKALQIEDTIHSIVEKYLNAQNFQQKIEIMNMASGDDSTSNQIQTYEVIGIKYKPDLVVCYFMDDFADNVKKIHIKEYSPYHEIGKNGELVYIPPIPKDTKALWERFKQTSRLYRLYANKFFESKLYHDLNVLKNDIIMRFKKNKGADKNSKIIDYTEMRRHICINEGWPLTLRLIKHFKETVEKNGSQFVLVDGFELTSNSVGTVYSNKDLEDFCLTNGIFYLPVYNKISQIKSYEHQERYWLMDNHPTPLANNEISLFFAEKIKNFLLNNNLI